MVTEECIAVADCIDELNEQIQQLREASRRLSPSKLTSRWWSADPEASRRGTPPQRASVQANLSGRTTADGPCTPSGCHSEQGSGRSGPSSSRYA